MHFYTPRDASASIPVKERGGDQLLMSYRRRATLDGIEAKTSRRVGPERGHLLRYRGSIAHQELNFAADASHLPPFRANAGCVKVHNMLRPPRDSGKIAS